MNDNEKTAETKAIEAEETAVSKEPTFLESLEAMKPFDEMHARDEEAKESVDTEEVIEDGAEAESELTQKADTEEVIEDVADAPFLTLPDGTTLTKEEAVAGYMRHIDYTQKGMELSANKKQLAKFSSFIDAMIEDEGFLKHVESYHKDNVASAPTQLQPMQIPERYKDDEFVLQQVELNNKLIARLDKVESGVGAINQTTADEQKHNEAKAIYNSRLQGAFNELKGQLGTDLSPKDFIDTMNKHFEGKGLTPEQYMPMIIGPDSTYFGTNVNEAYRDDIGKVAKDKVNSEREKRKPKGADKRALKATGKPPKAVSLKSPRLPNGRLDRKAFFRESPVQQLSEEDMG